MGKVRQFLTGIVVLLPLMMYYDSPILVSELTTLVYLFLFMGLGYLILLKLLVGAKFAGGDVIRGHVLLMSWMGIVSLVAIIFAPYNAGAGESLNSLVFLAMVTTILLCGLLGVFDYSYGVRLYDFVAIMLTGFLAIQIIAFYVLGIPLALKIPFLKVSEIYEPAFRYLQRMADIGRSARFSSLFSEPAHFAQYILPCVCMRLFGYKDYVKKNIILAMIMTVLMIVSASAIGIVSLIVIWCYFFANQGYKNAVIKAVAVMLGVLVLIGAYLYLVNFEFFTNVMGTLFVSSGGGVTKADYRIYRGFAVFSKLPPIHKLLGLGFRNADSAMTYYGINTRYDLLDTDPEYFNAVAQIMIYSGFVGLIVFVLMIIKLYRHSSHEARVLILVFLGLAISSAFFMSSMWLLYMLLIVAGTRGVTQMVKIDVLGQPQMSSSSDNAVPQTYSG